MTDPALGLTLARLQRRFARADGINSDLARRVFVLFAGDWALHTGGGTIEVVLLAYARELHRSPTNVSLAFDRLVTTGWLVEGPRTGPYRTSRRTFAPGPAWRDVTDPQQRQSA